MLLDSDGKPHLSATLFSIVEVRAKNKSASTIDGYLRSIMVFLIFQEYRNINLDSRLQSGQILSIGEIEELIRICRLPMKDIYAILNEIQFAVFTIMS